MKIKPVLTEKSMGAAKAGQYTFLVPVLYSKYQIRRAVSELFGVHVVRVRTENKAGRVRTTLMRKKISVKPQKKAIVTLRDKEKIDLFEGEAKEGKK